MKYKIEIYRDEQDEYRWRAFAKNGKNVANGGEGYKKKASCRRSLINFLRAYLMVGFEIVDTTKKGKEQ